MMEPYLRPPNRFIDENGMDNAGMKPNHWYWKCPTCGLTEIMPTHNETTMKGYKQKNPVTSKLTMHLGTYDRISQSWDRRKKRKGDLSDDDGDDIYRAFGAPDGVSLVSEREYTYSE